MGMEQRLLLYEVFAEIEDYMEMSKFITSENDNVAAYGYEYLSVKLV